MAHGLDSSLYQLTNYVPLGALRPAGGCKTSICPASGAPQFKKVAARRLGFEDHARLKTMALLCQYSQGERPELPKDHRLAH